MVSGIITEYYDALHNRISGKGQRVMKRIVSVLAVILFTLTTGTSCWGPPKPIPEEDAALAALKDVQKAYESNASYDDYVRLLSVADQKIGILKGVEKKNGCFFSEVGRCYASYEVSKKAWKLKEEVTDQKRRVDLDTALSFTMGFASVSLAKAAECYK
jgi:hypothetical protein